MIQELDDRGISLVVDTIQVLAELMIFTIHVYFFRFCTDGTM
jgi:hypothetical protein